MRNRAFRTLAVILSIMLLTNIPVQAGPVVVSQVIQVLSSYQNPSEIKLRSIPQNSTELASGVRSSVQTVAIQSLVVDDSLRVTDTSIAPIVGDESSLLSGVAVSSDPQKTVDVIDSGDVEGTVCDCGEIIVPGGGWPKWPLLFLAAIPFFFIHGCDDCDTPSPTPTTTLTPTTTSTTPGNIPEPASLLLFGTGLALFGAGLRRRYAKNKLSEEFAATEEE